VFSLPTSTGIAVVCKELFLQTLAISNVRLHRALTAKRSNGGITLKVRRGKHVKTKVPEESTAEVMSHINTFPRYISHYKIHYQEHSQFLAPNLSISHQAERFVQHLMIQKNEKEQL